MCASKDPELEATYQALLRESSPHEKAIQKDLARTFPSHKFFQRPKAAASTPVPAPGLQEGIEDRGRGQEELYNVVRAYSLYVSLSSWGMTVRGRMKLTFHADMTQASATCRARPLSSPPSS